MKKIFFISLIAIAFSFTSCISFGKGSVGGGTMSGGSMGGVLTSGNISSILTANDGIWKSQIDSTVSIQFLPTVAGRDSGQAWYNGAVTKNGRTSSFIWVASSYVDENNVRRSELYIKEGNSVGASKPSHRYVMSQSVYTLTVIFTEEGSGTGAKISTLPIPDGMYSKASN